MYFAHVPLNGEHKDFLYMTFFSFYQLHSLDFDLKWNTWKMVGEEFDGLDAHLNCVMQRDHLQDKMWCAPQGEHRHWQLYVGFALRY